MELITAIALLCQVNIGDDNYRRYADIYQLDCQKYYINCVLKDEIQTKHTLMKCVKERHVK